MRKAAFIGLCFIISLWSVNADATTRTVKTSGGDYTNPVTCLNASSAGDTCEMYTGTFASAGTVTVSGTAGNQITLTAASGQSPVVTATITISSRSYLTISYIAFTGTSGRIPGNGTSAHNIITHNTWTGAAGAQLAWFANSDTGVHTASDNVFSYNVLNVNNITSTQQGVKWYGDRNLFDHNEIYGGGGDCFELGGDYNVVRQNSCHDMNGQTSGEHNDFVQVVGGSNPTLRFSLIETNTIKDCPVSDCHALIARASGGQIADTIIMRYNYVYDWHTVGFWCGDSSDGNNTVPNCHMYNNTIALETTSSSAKGNCTWKDSNNQSFINNICYNTQVAGTSPTNATGAGTLTANGNIAFVTSYSSTWNTPYSSEATYAALRNNNPGFTNYPTSAAISSASPAYNAGVSLTTVATPDTGSGTSLYLSDAHFFQPGWAGTLGDWICVTTVSNCGQISSIDYTTNIATMTGTIARNDGDPVWLSKNSEGTTVLVGSAPDIGSYEVPGGDITNPAITITQPTTNATYGTSSAALTTLGGTASDDVALSSVACVNDRGGSGSVTGLTSWSSSTVTLSSGANVLTCTATDSSSNTASDVLTVTYTAPGTSTAYHPVAVLFDSAVGYWRLNEPSYGSGAAFDSSGHAHDAIYVGTPTFNQFGLADTTDVGILHPSSAGSLQTFALYTDTTAFDPTGTKSWTIEAWVKPTEAPTPDADPADIAGRSWYDAGVTENGVSLRVTPSTHYPQVRRCAAGACTTVTGTVALAIGTSYQIVPTYDGATMRLYVNGASVGTPVATSTSLSATGFGSVNDTGFCVTGCGSLTTFEQFYGVYDDVATYSSALSAAQILTHYRAPRRMRTLRIR